MIITIEWSLSLLSVSVLNMFIYDLAWLVLFSFIRNGRGSHQTWSYLTLYHIILSYSILSYSILSYLNLSYQIMQYYIILWYLYINMWCDTQCCWLTNNMYYHSIITLILGWLDSSILCCSRRSFGSCKSPTW